MQAITPCNWGVCLLIFLLFSICANRFWKKQRHPNPIFRFETKVRPIQISAEFCFYIFFRTLNIIIWISLLCNSQFCSTNRAFAISCNFRLLFYFSTTKTTFQASSPPKFKRRTIENSSLDFKSIRVSFHLWFWNYKMKAAFYSS